MHLHELEQYTATMAEWRALQDRVVEACFNLRTIYSEKLTAQEREARVDALIEQSPEHIQLVLEKATDLSKAHAAFSAALKGRANFRELYARGLAGQDVVQQEMPAVGSHSDSSFEGKGGRALALRLIEPELEKRRKQVGVSPREHNVPPLGSRAFEIRSTGQTSFEGSDTDEGTLMDEVDQLLAGSDEGSDDDLQGGRRETAEVDMSSGHDEYDPYLSCEGSDEDPVPGPCLHDTACEEANERLQHKPWKQIERMAITEADSELLKAALSSTESNSLGNDMVGAASHQLSWRSLCRLMAVKQQSGLIEEWIDDESVNRYLALVINHDRQALALWCMLTSLHAYRLLSMAGSDSGTKKRRYATASYVARNTVKRAHDAEYAMRASMDSSTACLPSLHALSAVSMVQVWVL